MILSQRPPIAWTIAGSDSGGGAGIQADLKTFHDFNTYGCSVITALTAQNSIAVGHIEDASHQSIAAQINALDSDLPANAIKLGLMSNTQTVSSVAKYLSDYDGFVVCDPVVKASSGDPLGGEAVLSTVKELIFPHVDLITPNKDEAEALLDRRIDSDADIEKAAHDLLSTGTKSVLITGGHFTVSDGQRRDFWTDGKQSFWIAGEAIDTIHTHGSGCTLSSAITASLAQGHRMLDALVLAKAYITDGFKRSEQLGGGPGPVAHAPQQITLENLPTLSRPSHELASPPLGQFQRCEALGLYPVVDSIDWIKRLAPLGIKTIQLRLKNKTQEEVRQQVKQAVVICKDHDVQFFLNDYWQIGIELGVYGVHLGQEDLDTANLNAIADAGLRLGISTHCYFEIARAHGIQPSYIAFGPIYETKTKKMIFNAQGLKQLNDWVTLLAPHYPVTAIGGINSERAPKVLATGVGSCAMVTAITEAEDVEATVATLLSMHEKDQSIKI
jgi:hydroxymethylpyrimidine kinase/phosphomethylpyrimidine kinase/thiamine-phosphate diphosphorylase